MEKATPAKTAIAQTGSHSIIGIEDIPDFLRDAPVEGVEELKGLVRPQRVKIIQKAADATLLEKWGVGDFVAMPSQFPLIEMPRDQKGNAIEDDAPSMRFVPVLFFREFLETNDIATRGTLPMIRRRSFDSRSDIAVFAANPATRTREMPDKTKVKYVDSLNFLIVPQIPTPFENEAIILSFSGGSYSLGQHLCSLIKMRKASLYNCVFQVRPVHLTNPQGFDYWGAQPDNPEDGSPWVTKEQSEFFAELHRELKAALDSAKLVIDHEFEREPGDTAATSAGPAQF